MCKRIMVFGKAILQVWINQLDNFEKYADK